MERDPNFEMPGWVIGSDIDYRALLAKYIQHVGQCEGVTFIDDRRDFYYESDVPFTPEEWAELVRLDALGTPIPRCAHVSPTPWGNAQCALPDGHEDRHAYSPSESLHE